MKHNEIIYEEGWREASPLVKTDEEKPLDEIQPPADQTREENDRSRPLLISIQLILCLLAALVLFLLKTMDSEGYHQFMDYYHEELQKPIVSQEVFHSVDELFRQNVTVQATPDETADSES